MRSSASDGAFSLIRILTYAGAIPFLIAAVALAAHLPLSRFPIPALAALRAYSLAIAAFMAGTVWGYVLPGLDRPNARVFLILSNALALAVWAADLIPDARVGLAIQILTFLLLLLADVWATRSGFLRRDYLNLRMGVTALVVGALALGWSTL